VITECNEKRKRGELKTFKAAVECSNPKVYAAWKEASDPNLDLLNVLLAARLVGAENVDRGRITEAEYQLQLAELNASPDMLIFHGEDEGGRPIRLLQHYSQLSVLLCAVPREKDTEPKIGFVLHRRLKEL